MKLDLLHKDPTPATKNATFTPLTGVEPAAAPRLSGGFEESGKPALAQIDAVLLGQSSAMTESGRAKLAAMPSDRRRYLRHAIDRAMRKGLELREDANGVAIVYNPIERALHIDEQDIKPAPVDVPDFAGSIGAGKRTSLYDTAPSIFPAGGEADKTAQRVAAKLPSGKILLDNPGDVDALVEKLFSDRSIEERRDLAKAFRRVAGGNDPTGYEVTTNAGQKITIKANREKWRPIDFARADVNALMDEEPLKLGRVRESCAHKISEAFKSKTMLFLTKAEENHVGSDQVILDALTRTNFDTFQIFLIQHDWAAAFSSAKDFDGGELQMPADACLFETRLNGRRIVLEIVRTEKPVEWIAFIFIETPGGWGTMAPLEWRNGKLAYYTGANNPKKFDRIADYLSAQVRAILIALDAEIAETETIRAPHKLNRARERQGKLPLYDFHVVNLARRTRPAPLDDAVRQHDTGRHPRMHFVRGHWRHYEAHKIWIKWHLRGDPDLGFVDKEYRL